MSSHHQSSTSSTSPHGHEQKGPFEHKHSKGSSHTSSDAVEKESLSTLTFLDLWNSYPKEASIRDLSERIGGDLLAADMKAVDVSCLKLSSAINASGHHITDPANEYTGTMVKDCEGNSVILDCSRFLSLLNRRLGKPRVVSSQTLILGRQGIVLLQSIKSLHGGSYIDLWNGKETASVEDYFHEAGEIAFWELL